MQRLLNMDVYREMKLSKKRDDLMKQEDENEGILMTKGKPCDFFILILEGRVEVTIGKEEHKFQEGPFSCYGEAMLEQAMVIPSSPFIQSSQDVVTKNAVNNANNLRKATTQTHISSSDVSTRRSVDALPLARHGWTPDYSLRALSDCMYLKIRRNTYMVAIKASRMNNMNSEVDGNLMKEQELEEYLKKITENDADFTGVTPNIMSPDNLWQSDGKGASYAGTPTEFRRESIRSSLSMMKQKIFGTGAGMGRSCTSIDKPSKDEFWDGMTNPALSTSKEDITDAGNIENNGKVETEPGVPNSSSIPLTSVVPEVNIQTRNHDIKVGNKTTVISVRGSGASKDNTGETGAPLAEKSGANVNNAQDISTERTSSFSRDDVENPVS